MRITCRSCGMPCGPASLFASASCLRSPSTAGARDAERSSLFRGSLDGRLDYALGQYGRQGAAFLALAEDDIERHADRMEFLEEGFDVGVGIGPVGDHERRIVALEQGAERIGVQYRAFVDLAGSAPVRAD